jgi:hypothetical protein
LWHNRTPWRGASERPLSGETPKGKIDPERKLAGAARAPYGQAMMPLRWILAVLGALGALLGVAMILLGFRIGGPIYVGAGLIALVLAVVLRRKPNG